MVLGTAPRKLVSNMRRFRSFRVSPRPSTASRMVSSLELYDILSLPRVFLSIGYG